MGEILIHTQGFFGFSADMIEHGVQSVLSLVKLGICPQKIQGKK